MDMGAWLNNLCFSVAALKVKFHVLVSLSLFSSIEPPIGPVELGRVLGVLASLTISKVCLDMKLSNDSINSASLGFVLFSGIISSSGWWSAKRGSFFIVMSTIFTFFLLAAYCRLWIFFIC